VILAPNDDGQSGAEQNGNGHDRKGGAPCRVIAETMALREGLEKPRHAVIEVSFKPTWTFRVAYTHCQTESERQMLVPQGAYEGGSSTHISPTAHQSIGGTYDVLVEENGGPSQAGNKGGAENADEESDRVQATSDLTVPAKPDGIAPTIFAKS
jgi:hypothetical protein